MKMLVHMIFNSDTIQNITSETKERLTHLILHDQEINFIWSNVMEEVGKEESNTLLNMVVDVYVTIRGYGFAKRWVEKYKQDNKETMQKSKSLFKMQLHLKLKLHLSWINATTIKHFYSR